MNPFFNIGWNAFDSDLFCGLWCVVCWFIVFWLGFGELSDGLLMMADLGDGKVFDLVSLGFIFFIELEKVTLAVIIFVFLEWFVKLLVFCFSWGWKLTIEGS